MFDAMSAAPAADKTAYLANVMAIARANGFVSPAEQRVFQAVAARIGANTAEIAEALKRVDGRDFRLKVMSDPPSRLSNLEDMLMMGLADGKLDESESGPLEQLAMELKFTQVDVDMALKRAQLKLSKLATIASPPIAAPADVSPDRRARTARTAATTSRPHQQPQRIRETVRRTTPRRQVEHVLTPMLTAPWQTKTASVAQVVMPSEDAPLLDPSLATATEGRDGGLLSAMPVADRLADEEPLSLRDACMQTCAETGDPGTYCHGLNTGDPNVWGCRLAEMALTTGADWLACGRFRDGRTFVFDRDEIAKLLEERLAIAAGCPYLHLDQVTDALAAFPSKAMPGPRWTYRRATTPDSGVEIVQREYIHGCPLTQRFRSECMDPVGTGEFRRILRDKTRRRASLNR